jgi:hypothetical protein
MVTPKGLSIFTELVAAEPVVKFGWPITAEAAAPLPRAETLANFNTRLLSASDTQRLSEASTNTWKGPFIFEAVVPEEEVVKSGWPKTRSGALQSREGSRAP